VLDLLGDRRAGANRDFRCVLVEAHVDELHAGRVRLEAHAVHRAHRVRAREPHAQIRIEHDDPVADTRRVLELVVVLTEREASLRDHVREPVEQRHVVVFELTDPPSQRQTRLPHDDRDHIVTRTYRDVLHVRSLDGTEQQRVALHDLALGPRAPDERERALVDDRIDEVRGVHGLARCRPDLRHDHEPRRVTFEGRQQQQVGEAEVGERLPRRGETLHMPQRFAAQRRRRHALDPCGKRYSPMRARPATSAMSDSKFGTLTTTSGRRDSSARSSASRRATTS
jgi:hypothetical protein